MNELAMMRIFVQVVEDGSFSATARRANMSVSSIARQIASLEHRLGARLLNRTTRHQRVTEVGRIYYERTRTILHDLDSANDIVTSYYRSIKGTLSVHIRTSAAWAVLPKLPTFLAQYPEVSINLTLTEERADLVSEGVDVAVWLGHLSDSSFMARRLTTTHRLICGSPSYFEKYGEPKEPNDLKEHNCICYKGSHYSENVWRFIKGEEVVDVPVSGNLRISTGWALNECLLSGLGIAIVQEWTVTRDLREGRLRNILTDYDLNPVEFDVPLYAVYPHSHGLPPKTRAFIDFLVELFREHEQALLEVA
jgi:DNA-binding transcriptional LysR family regulator